MQPPLQAKQSTTMKTIQQLDQDCGETAENTSSGWSEVKQRKKRKFLVGNTETYCDIKTIPRLVQLHVTRLKPGTKPIELQKFLEHKLTEVECEIHPSRRPEIYSSMKVTINRESLKTAWNRETWPNGSIVSFFKKRMPSTKTDPPSLTST
ncbi:hypothetical protein JTB14_025904 [Gonioctena quinquepunctata]|nr:hypothetical protein JTB14_025904 [Gonioctena quinquepunctata]